MVKTSTRLLVGNWRAQSSTRLLTLRMRALHRANTRRASIVFNSSIIVCVSGGALLKRNPSSPSDAGSSVPSTMPPPSRSRGARDRPFASSLSPSLSSSRRSFVVAPPAPAPSAPLSLVAFGKLPACASITPPAPVSSPPPFGRALAAARPRGDTLVAPPRPFPPERPPRRLGLRAIAMWRFRLRRRSRTTVVATTERSARVCWSRRGDYDATRRGDAVSHDRNTKAS